VREIMNSNNKRFPGAFSQEPHEGIRTAAIKMYEIAFPHNRTQLQVVGDMSDAPEHIPGKELVDLFCTFSDSNLRRYLQYPRLL